MDESGASSDKVFGRFTEPAHQVLDLARAEAERAGHRYLGPEHLLLGLLAEGHSRGLPDGYHGAAGPLLAGLGVNLGRLQDAAASELRGSQR
jgi:ATP-dependent Clp protease ATP-binding subunit ClpC